MVCFFFSSRRRHTRCALVTGVQTCALPISRPAESSAEALGRPVASDGEARSCRDPARLRRAGAASRIPRGDGATAQPLRYRRDLCPRRSEERRVGNEGVNMCRFWLSAYHLNTKRTISEVYLNTPLPL